MAFLRTVRSAAPANSAFALGQGQQNPRVHPLQGHTLTMNKLAAIAELPLAAPTTIIAVGGELKNSICVAEEDRITITPTMGSLTDVENYRRFICELNQLVARIAGRSASVAARRILFAHDLHPAYLSTMTARRFASGLEWASCEAIQHHHAHIAACMAEHGIVEPVIGVACDGVGYGTDGASWGCEILYAMRTDFERCAHLQYFPLPGGDAAAKQTWRPALGLVHHAFEGDLPGHARRSFDRVPAEAFSAVHSMLVHGFNCPPTSSLGRLFDAVAFLAGVCDFNEFEGQAAMQLQEAVEDGSGEPYSFSLFESEDVRQIAVCEMVDEICQDVRDGVDGRVIAARFHATVVRFLSQAALEALRVHDAEMVALSGGCFLNRILVEKIEQLLLEGGVKRVLKHEQLSPGDASLSLGQAVVATARLGESR